MKLFVRTAIIAASIAIIPSAANATYIIDILQVGPDVVATGSGSLNLTGMTEVSTNPTIPQGMNPRAGYLELGVGSNVNVYSGLLYSPTYIGNGNIFTSSSSVSGDPFALYANLGQIALPETYTSGSPLSNSATWLGQTFTTLGLNPPNCICTLTFPLPSDTVILHIGDVSSVPEPSTWAMMLLGFGAVAAGVRLNRKRQPTIA